VLTVAEVALTLNFLQVLGVVNSGYFPRKVTAMVGEGLLYYHG
jgi:hypothetical protein